MPIDWTIMTIGAFVGAFVSILVASVSRIAKAIYNKRRVPAKYHKVLTHMWRHYYYNVLDNSTVKFFNDEEWTIKKTWYGSYKVNVINNYDRTTYIGTIEYENGYLLFELKNHDEKLFLRCPLHGLNENTPRPKLITFGSARDYQNRASVNATVLSRSELDESEFRELLGQNVISHEDEKLMVIK